MAFPTPFVNVGPVGIWGQTSAGTYAAIGVTTPTAATNVLTLASNAVAGETVTVGQQVYVWAASANVQTPNVVKVGADASTSIDNLIAAINATAASQGSLYSFNTIPNTQVTAATGAGDTMGITAIAAGANGNLIATTETMSGGSWASATLTGGAPAALNVDISVAGTTQDVNLTKVGGAAVSLGQALAAASIPVVLPAATNVPVTNGPLTNFGAGNYETVAASATAQVLGGSGAIGDYIAGLLVIPATTSPGNVLLIDNATSITVFTGGASSVSNLVPFFIPLGMLSVGGAWKVTTGSNVSVIGIGKFT